MHLLAGLMGPAVLLAGIMRPLKRPNRGGGQSSGGSENGGRGDDFGSDNTV